MFFNVPGMHLKSDESYAISWLEKLCLCLKPCPSFVSNILLCSLFAWFHLNRRSGGVLVAQDGLPSVVQRCHVRFTTSIRHGGGALRYDPRAETNAPMAMQPAENERKGANGRIDRRENDWKINGSMCRACTSRAGKTSNNESTCRHTV